MRNAEVVDREGVRARRRSAGRASRPAPRRRRRTTRNRTQKTSVGMLQRRRCRAAEQPSQRTRRPASSVVTLLQRLDDRRHDLEQIADDAVVGDLEDRRVGILVDRDDRAARPSCRPGAGWRRRCRARGRASARRSGPSCRPGAPSAASRRRRSAATRRARRRARRRASAPAAMFSCSLMPRPTDDDALGLRQIDRLLRFLKRRLRLLADRRRVDVDVERAHRRRRRALRRLVGAKRADLERDEVRRRPLRHDVGGQLALEHRPRRTPARRRRS